MLKKVKRIRLELAGGFIEVAKPAARQPLFTEAYDMTSQTLFIRVEDPVGTPAWRQIPTEPAPIIL